MDDRSHLLFWTAISIVAITIMVFWPASGGTLTVLLLAIGGAEEYLRRKPLDG